MRNFIIRAAEMTKRNKRAAAARGAYESYKLSSDTRLEDVYNNFSEWKNEAFIDIKQEMQDVGGYNIKIISYTAQFFTCGYLVDLDGETYFVRHTASYMDCVKVS